MSLNPVMRAIAEHWSSAASYLTAEQLQRFRMLVGRYTAPGATPREQLRAIEELADMLSLALPAGHPVRRAIAYSGTTRSVRTAEPDQELIDELRELLEAEDARIRAELLPKRDSDVSASARPARAHEPWTREPRSPEEIEQEAMARLAAAPALSAEDLRSRGGDPGQRYLIRLEGRDGPRFPLFQFDAAWRPHRLVLSINALLGADTDPWGVADWWLGRHAWLDRPPAESIGQVADDVLLATARTMVEAG